MHFKCPEGKRKRRTRPAAGDVKGPLVMDLPTLGKQPQYLQGTLQSRRVYHSWVFLVTAKTMVLLPGPGLAHTVLNAQKKYLCCWLQSRALGL